MRFLILFIALLTFWLPAPVRAQDDDGASYLESLLQSSLSGAGRQVTIRGFSGALSSTARIEELAISDDQGQWFSARDVVLNWSRLALLTGRVQVQEFSAAEVVLSRLPQTEAAPPSPEAEPFSLPDLPVSINIDSLRIERLEIGEPVFGIANVSRATGSANLSGGEGALQVRLERTDGQRGVFNIAGSYANTNRHLSVDVELDEGPGGIVTTLAGLPGAPALTLSVKGDAPIDDFAADIRLATANQDRLTGQVTARAVEAAPGQPAGAARNFTFDLNGDIRALLPEQFRAFFGSELTLTADATRQPDSSLAVPQFVLRAEAIDLNGQLRIAADGLPSFVDVKGSIHAPAGTQGPVVLPIATPTELSGADLAIAYDDTVSETWTINMTARDFKRPDMTISTLRLEGGGGVMRETAQDAPRLDANLRFSADGISLDDPALARAVGKQVEGTTVFVWQSGDGVVTMPVLNVRGEDYSAVADLVFNGLNAALRVSGKVTASLADISRFSDLAGRPLSGRAETQASGAFEPLSGMFDVVADVTGTDLKAAQEQLDRLLAGQSRITLSAKRDETGTEIRDAQLTAQSLSLQASGNITSNATDVKLNGRFADARVLGPGFSGSVDVDGRAWQVAEGLRLTLDATGNDLRIGQPQADGLLRGQSRIRFAGVQNDDVLTIDTATIDATTLKLTATGRYAPGNTDVSLDGAFTDLSVLGQGYGGAGAATARVHDTPEGLRLETNVSGQDLQVGQQQADGLLRGQSRIDLAAVQNGERITIDRLAVNATTLTLTASGRYDPNDTDLQAAFSFSDLGVLGSGFHGALTADARALSEPGGIRITADSRASGLALGGQPQVNALLKGDGTLALNVLRGPDGFLQIDRFAFQNPQLSANVNGEVQGEARNVTVDARLNNLAILVPGFPGPVTLRGTVVDAENQLRLNLAAQGPGQIDTRLTGTMARDFSRSDLALTGSSQLGLINPFLSARSAQGLVRFDLTMNGPLGLNALGGTVTASNLRIVDPALNIALSGGTARATLASGTARIDATTSVEGGGTLSAAGTIGMTAPFAADLQVSAREARLQDPQLYTTSLTGSVAITGPLTGGARIAGTMNLGQTDVRVPSSFGGTFTIPTIRHIAEPAAVRATRVRADLIQTQSGSSGGGSGIFTLDVTINAPSRIFIRGRGLDAELGGAIHIGGTTANIVPSGQFELIRGRLDFLDRRFDLTSGSFFLQGDFDAFINLTAQTNTNQGLTAIINVTGPVNDPDINITSNPSLPEEEVLAQIIFGRDLSSISPLQAAQLASAVATLAGSGGDGLVGRFRKSVGLDDFDVVPDKEGNTGVKAGRYLSDNVYTEVVVGSGNQSQINLNLDLSKSFTVRGSVGEDGNTGIGVYFERDY
ncbi:hypothetical protein CG51_03200 [Haematobacter missouriensis]|uniref:Translocation/assembly module TamB n=1 Tax=Haematobacter missouriensis TaxID=366616 RepID=A0A212AWN3_9RHOB|nr:translocation/assembly module TamB domain-containing protein [Haematobacter missouriensis]KFI33893.1 hypothetical protein CG51_03200 [Haematobacter missouriensis]OWJ71335.1 translocation/assembly module TamB [Haematobacter missouriensis]OWJ85889.1 translocation/assembly module TamB [Haematobacter missouriensis]